jgi:hypothetical protein
VPLLEHGPEQYQEIEVDAQELSWLQHGHDFLSLASRARWGHLYLIATTTQAFNAPTTAWSIPRPRRPDADG